MHAKLIEILEEKKREVKRLKKERLSFPENPFSKGIRDFEKALTSNAGIDLIAEIKFGSPSAGIIREDSDFLSIGRAYEKAGAATISLLTDKKFFKGDLKNLPFLKQAVSLPILRKDFIVDEIQITESARFGADAVLLIARILSVEQLKRLLDASREYGIGALTEIHDKMDLDKALKCDAHIIGINNRDLDTFEINTDTTLELASLIPSDRVVISESGIRSGRDIQALNGMNIQAVLVGSALMSSADPGKKAMEMVMAGKGA
ncbi:MAG: indole-3-glycerol phosphate synthase TrpC [Deltaproteobacteria bacterium]|jgi:indole-3-glycerol phosphate synthase|nr:indole-3-glycerol phosphate synthase TrpC [Deltaproteobacteria bacterium]